MIDIKHEIDSGIVEVTIHGKLEEYDFDRLAPVVDAIIEHDGVVSGLLLNASDFHGWDGLGGVLTHLRFVKAHHKDVRRVAIVGDQRWQEIMPKIAAHFIHAEPQHFSLELIDTAREWLRDDRST